MSITKEDDVWFERNYEEVAAVTHQHEIKGAASLSQAVLLNALHRKRFHFAVLFDDLVTIWCQPGGDLCCAIAAGRQVTGKRDVAWAAVFKDGDRIGVIFEDEVVPPRRVSWDLDWDTLKGRRVEPPYNCARYEFTRALPSYVRSPDEEERRAMKRT
jgi:hypothetical protein